MSAARDYNVSTLLEDMPESKRKGRIYDSYDRHNAGVITRAVFSALERAGGTRPRRRAPPLLRHSEVLESSSGAEKRGQTLNFAPTSDAAREVVDAKLASVPF